MATIYKFLWFTTGVGAFAMLYMMPLGLPDAILKHSWWKEGGFLLAFITFTTLLTIFSKKYEKSKRISDEMADRRSRN